MSGQLRKAIKWVWFMRIYLNYLLILSFVSLLLMLVEPFQGDPHNSFLQLVMAGVSAFLPMVAVHFADRRPVPPTMALAGVFTILFVVRLTADEPMDKVWIRSLIQPAFWMVSFWLITAQAIHLTWLANTNPDGYLARLMRGESAPGERGHEAEALEQNLVRRIKQGRRLRVLSGVLVLLLAVGFVGLSRAN